MIHVCLALTDNNGRYSKFTGTTLISVFENISAPVTAHILHDDTLSDDNRKKFSWLAGHYGQIVRFHDIEKICPDELKFLREKIADKLNLHSRIGAFYRLLIKNIADTNKIIYLDSDIIVNTDIAELWRIDLGDKIFAAVPEILSVSGSVDNMKIKFPLCSDGLVSANDYFNSGVMLMNLDHLRSKTEVVSRCLELVSQGLLPCGYFDQDVLNYCFSTQILKLPTKFNRFTQSARQDGEILQKKIYHYAGGRFGFGLGIDAKDPFNRLWLEYFSRTPWFDVQVIGRLFEEIQRRHKDLNRQLLNLALNLPHKKRVFFVSQEKFSSLKTFFTVRDDEEIIFVEMQNAYAKLFAAMKQTRGQKIFFILSPESEGLCEALTQEGFVPYEDFIDAFELLTAAHGNSFNSYPFALAM